MLNACNYTSCIVQWTDLTYNLSGSWHMMEVSTRTGNQPIDNKSDSLFNSKDRNVRISHYLVTYPFLSIYLQLFVIVYMYYRFCYTLICRITGKNWFQPTNNNVTIIYLFFSPQICTIQYWFPAQTIHHTMYSQLHNIVSITVSYVAGYMVWWIVSYANELYCN